LSSALRRLFHSIFAIGEVPGASVRQVLYQGTIYA
jgi:hypothetical protein